MQVSISPAPLPIRPPPFPTSSSFLILSVYRKGKGWGKGVRGKDGGVCLNVYGEACMFMYVSCMYVSVHVSGNPGKSMGNVFV